MSSDQTYKDERERAERQRVHDRIKKELNTAAARRVFMVEMLINPDEPDALKMAEGRLRIVSGVMRVEVL